MDALAQSKMVEDVFVSVVMFVFILILIVGLFYVYLIPTLIAYKHKHPQRVFIMLLNLFGGNTLVGWIAALVWARTSQK